MRRLGLSILVAATLVLSSVSTAAAITKTATKDFDHPYVGLIAFYDSSWEWSHRCTGELLSPTVVLTAGHCTRDDAGGVMAHARIWLQQDAGTRYDGTTADPVTGYPDACATGTLGSLCAESDEMYDYASTGTMTFANGLDVGIVILDQSISLAKYAQLPTAGALDPLWRARGLKDTLFGVSGYGVSYRSPVRDVSYRERLFATSTLVNTVSAINRTYNLQLNGNGGGRGGTCGGDSGGPVFYPASSETVVAVTSFGLNAWCRGDGWYYRIDRQEVLDWINGGYAE